MLIWAKFLSEKCSSSCMHVEITSVLNQIVSLYLIVYLLAVLHLVFREQQKNSNGELSDHLS